MASTTSKELSQWLAYLAVREERRAEAEREAHEGYDPETIHWN